MRLSEESYLAKSKHCLLSRFCLSRARCLNVFSRGPFLCSGAHTISLVGEVVVAGLFPWLFFLVSDFCFGPLGLARFHRFPFFCSGLVGGAGTHIISLVGEFVVVCSILLSLVRGSFCPFLFRHFSAKHHSTVVNGQCDLPLCRPAYLFSLGIRDTDFPPPGFC